MTDDTNTSQPVTSGGEGVTNAEGVDMSDQHKSFFDVFRLGNKHKEELSAASSERQSEPQPTSEPPSSAQSVSDFSSSLGLNSEGGQQPAQEPTDTPPSMEGATVIPEPNPLPTSGSPSQPGSISQEPTVSRSFGSDVTGAAAGSELPVEPKIETNPPVATAEAFSPPTPDLSTDANLPLPSNQEGIESIQEEALKGARTSLANIGEEVAKALRDIDQRLEANLTNESQPTTPEPIREPAETKF
ncbi:hypothetical protein HYT32_02180 [Candidatus Roizmanbacteria bacterium]|nr:hypothetical protein [Candidatus Roizmanbacteria bacterium]